MLRRPTSAVSCDLHKWGRVLKTPAPWRPAQLDTRPDARDRLLPDALTPSTHGSEGRAENHDGR